MSRHDPAVALRDMLDHACEAIAFLDETSAEDLAADRKLMLAVIRLIEVVGEAANRVPRDVQVKHSAIPWRDIVGMRNRLIHGYDELDGPRIWSTVMEDFPALVRDLERALGN